MNYSARFCPYVGLKPFTEADRDYFFGREREIRLVGANLYASKLTALYGESGVGKSSLLMAGVAPTLRKQPRTAVVIFREWQRPEALATLKAAIAQACDEASGETLGLDPALPLDDLLAEAGKRIGGTTLILLDQFEEYFLYYPPGSPGEVFDAELARAVNRSDVNAGFMLSIREDSLSKLDRFRARIPSVLANPLRIRHLGRTAARNAIVKPLEVYNQRPEASASPVSIEPALVDALVEQTSAGRVSLAQAGTGVDASAQEETRVEAPFLQLVLTRIWDEEQAAGSRQLRLATLERLGGAERIVRTHLDQVMSRLAPGDQTLCAEFFDRLVTPSGTKIACRVDDLKQWAGQRSGEVERVVIALSSPDARILRAIDPRPGEPPQYEIFHDVLAHGVLDWRSRFVEARKLEEAEREAREAQQRLRRSRRFAIAMMVLAFVAFGLLGLTVDAYNWAKNNFLPPDSMLMLQRFRMGYAPIPEMVAIPAGNFDMGEQDKQFVQAVGPANHKYLGVPGKNGVEIPGGLKLGKYEVTYDEYDYYVWQQQRAGHREVAFPNTARGGRGARPVVNVSWNEATAYTKWLSERTLQNCRLPKEAEWEYAARAGTETAYWWGDEAGKNRANCDGCGSQWDKDQSAPVGSFAANRFGLHDTSGNVWEWTCSAWSDEFNGGEHQCAAEQDPVARALRGGSWGGDAVYARSSARSDYYPVDRHGAFGFRVLCSSPIE